MMKINCQLVTRVLTSFIREESNKAGFERNIIGVSGGLDSTVCAYLAARAVGPQNIFGLIMPFKDYDQEGVQLAEECCRLLGINFEKIDLSPQIEAYFSRHPVEQPVLRGNKMARERMSILYDYSARLKAMILGTSNKSELLIGYGTIHGDLACGINPMGDLYKTQVRQLARYLEVPEKIISRKPTAGLWPGQTDEDEIGLSYEELDEILFKLVDERLTPDEAIKAGLEEKKVRQVSELIRKSEYKRKMPPIAKLSERTVGHDFLYPYDWGK